VFGALGPGYTTYMARDEKFLNRAIGVAMTSKCRWKHGAVVTKGSRVVCWSPNVFRNHSEIDYQGATFHAEDAALRDLSRLTGETYGRGDFSGYTIYVARVNNLGVPRLSRPCGPCMRLLTSRGVHNIVYTNETGGLSHEITS
jgi:deoxycytidylate deaminase